METVKGFRDIKGYEAKVREKIKNTIIKNYRLWGFEPAETPILEQENFVKGENSSDEAVSDIFKLIDKGKRNLALRYEFTFQLKRLIIDQKLPYKRYQIGEVFRDEPVSANRYRQISQCDADIVGATPKDEADILALVSKIFQELGIEFTIKLNNRELLNEILTTEKIKEKDTLNVIREIDKLDKLSEKEIKENLKKYKAEKVLDIFKEKESFFKKYKAYSQVEELKKLCKPYGVNFEFSPSLARGLSYYNGTIFEFKSKEMKETIGAGGAYKINGMQSIGISFGLDRLSQIVPKNDYVEKGVVIISLGQDEEAIKLVQNLRNKEILAEIWNGKGVSKALEYANSYNMPFIIFIGEEEVKQKKFKLKNMMTGKEKLISEKELPKELENSII
jgi:histidyl-tRNA synthetase